eukprot:CAMPEP_0172646564 /NCGR_PEP_ID=MMETSP1068-20121228/240309_1 /TAXON_ID=35684 /ORGANISM="Pseudopedinella elastica, Strain CCMP716" /LENGTH=257 /DNA_ID=CAMNT_0013460829 /DNA_START=383 /DNA_END=1153 /DNA_ORIENTATION=-
MEEEKGELPKLKSGGKGDNKKSVVFNACKREQFHPNSGYKKLFRRLRATYKVSTNKDDLSPDRLDEANIIVFGGPRERFTENEMDELKGFVNKGGSVVFFVGEGGDGAAGTNVNAVIEEYGMEVKQDAVVRTVYYKYLYPKEVFIANGILQPSIAATKNAGSSSTKSKKSLSGGSGGGAGKAGAANSRADTGSNGGLNFVYPHGASLSCSRPAMAILSSGPISYPLNRPVAGVYESSGSGAFPGTSAAAAAAAAAAA